MRVPAAIDCYVADGGGRGYIWRGLLELCSTLVAFVRSLQSARQWPSDVQLALSATSTTLATIFLPPAKEVMFSAACVRSFVSRITQRLLNWGC